MLATQYAAILGFAWIWAVKAATFGCGTSPPTAAHLAASASFAREEAEMAANDTLDTRSTIEIDLYIHVVALTDQPEYGYIPKSQIKAQVDALQRAFAPSGIVFRFKGADWTVHEEWAGNLYGSELAMKKALRRGTYRTLNVYIQEGVGPGETGICTFPFPPEKVKPGSDLFWMDGCRVLFSTVPGGELENYNLGITAVHEVGHWLGLMHTFEGGCAGGGDGVHDTPAEASYAEGCPVGRDSCPGQKGVDPIHNYLDYSYDACKTEFTKGQKRRMKSFWRHWRIVQG